MICYVEQPQKLAVVIVVIQMSKAEKRDCHSCST